jgi:Flp pilus assembly protein TadD
LVQRDRCEEAISHLERGLLLQAARRRQESGSDAPTPAEAKMRHMLGYALATTGQSDAARREYQRVLSTQGIDPVLRDNVEAALTSLDAGE